MIHNHTQKILVFQERSVISQLCLPNETIWKKTFTSIYQSHLSEKNMFIHIFRLDFSIPIFSPSISP